MDRNSRSSWLRSARSRGALLLALLVLLGVGGYLLTSTTIRGDRDDAAVRRARVEAVHAQEVLGRARAYVDGLAEVLAQEPEPGQARFARWAGATSASVGLNDVVWVEQVPGTERRRYERLRGLPITRVTAAGRIVPAPPASYYLPATYTSANRPELRPGVDVSRFPALAAAIRDRARIFAVGASRPGALGREPGFFLLEAATFARGRGSRGYLVAFVPRGWFSTTLGDDPRRFAISEDGRRIEGELDSIQASAGFETLGRDWRIDTSREPLSHLQSMLPWLALAWPFAAAGIALAIGRTITRRRRLEMDVAERSAELERSEAYLAEGQRLTRAGSVAFAVPTWEVTHSSAEHSRLYGFDPERGLPSLSDFSDRIHPEDRSIPGEALERGVRERRAVEAEFRVVVPDAGERRLLATAQPVFDATGTDLRIRGHGPGRNQTPPDRIRTGAARRRASCAAPRGHARCSRSVSGRGLRGHRRRMRPALRHPGVQAGALRRKPQPERVRRGELGAVCRVPPRRVPPAACRREHDIARVPDRAACPNRRLPGNGQRPDRRRPEGGRHSVDHRRADHGRGTALGRHGCRQS